MGTVEFGHLNYDSLSPSSNVPTWREKREKIPIKCRATYAVDYLVKVVK